MQLWGCFGPYRPLHTEILLHLADSRKGRSMFYWLTTFNGHVIVQLVGNIHSPYSATVVIVACRQGKCCALIGWVVTWHACFPSWTLPLFLFYCFCKCRFLSKYKCIHHQSYNPARQSIIFDEYLISESWHCPHGTKKTLEIGYRGHQNISIENIS